MDTLRQCMFAPCNRGKKIEKTEEGIAISENLLTNGFVGDDEIERFPGVTKLRKIHPVMECTQNIPCNPCQDACKRGCITIGKNITSLPVVDNEHECIGCGMCVASCSGQAIFLESPVEETVRRSVNAKLRRCAPVLHLTIQTYLPSRFRMTCL